MSQLQQLREEAVQLGMCEKFVNLWNDKTTLDDLCRLFYMGQDFCIEHNFPSVSQILSLDERVLASHGIYASGEHCLKSACKMIFLGDANVRLTIPDYQRAIDIYVRHNAHLTLDMGKYSFAYISVFDNGIVSVDNKGDGAILCASRFGGNIRNEEKFDKINKK